MTWGNTPWEDAHQLPGSDHLGKAKRFLMHYPWWQIGPHPEWVEPHWADELFGMQFTCGRHDVPMAAGIPGKLRIIYLPLGVGLKEVVNLEKGVSYEARLFNPVTGDEQQMGRIRTDAAGKWQPKFPHMSEWFPFPIYQDWILALETKGVRK
jgi:hypothetical protein